MRRSVVRLTEHETARVQQLRAQVGMREAARRLRVGHDTLYRAVEGRTLYPSTAVAIRMALDLAGVEEPQS